MTDTDKDITAGMVSIDDAAEQALTEILATPDPEPQPSTADMFVGFPNGTFVRLTSTTGSITAELVFGDDAGTRIKTEVGLDDLITLDSALSILSGHVTAARRVARDRGEI